MNLIHGANQSAAQYQLFVLGTCVADWKLQLGVTAQHSERILYHIELDQGKT
jgi:hypothetical protein